MLKKNKKILSLLIIVTIIFLNFAYLNISKADNFILDPLTGNDGVSAQAGYATADQDSIIYTAGYIVRTVLSLLGIMFLIFIISSGIQWMTAGGNEEKVTKAQQRIKNATIGLIVIVLAYAITVFLMTQIHSASQLIAT